MYKVENNVANVIALNYLANFASISIYICQCVRAPAFIISIRWSADLFLSLRASILLFKPRFLPFLDQTDVLYLRQLEQNSQMRKLNMS